tara:strand:- start:325 stop:1560 length:1236 start_codon:yes stop_codon:yes gene_type:complete
MIHNNINNKIGIEWKDVQGLTPYARNSRTHSDEQVAQICASIKEFGWTNPILIDDESTIIAGHGRLLASQRLSLKEVPTITLTGLTEAQKRAYVIADNRLALNAGWDNDMLAIELKDLADEGFDLDLTGFDTKEVDALLAEADKIEDGLTDEDAVPELPEVPTSVLGDVWILGRHRLVCGDSTEIDTVDKLMDGHIADMVFTDPPYGISYQSNMRVKSNKFDVIKNDNIFLDIAPIIETKSKGWVFVWTSWKVLPDWIKQMESFGYPTNQIIWFKGGGGIGDLKKTFSSDYETALVWHRGAELTGKRIGSVWKIDKDGATNYLHPTQKPVSLGVEAIEKTTRSGASVLDLFGGSGSTLIACEKTGRNARLVELDPLYVDVIIKRWQAFTGQEAVNEESNKTYNEMSNGKTL